MKRQKDVREPWVPRATREERDEQLRRLWHREREEERERHAEDPRGGEAPDFRWWGPY